MIQVKNVSKRFGPEPLFEGITFTLGKGSRIGLFGRNGSGKSTIFRMILGDEEPTSGEISMPRGYTLGSLSQHLSFSAPTAREEVHQAVAAGEEYRGDMILLGLGVSDELADRPLKDLSGGYQLRVSLARALVSEPNLLLLDEPTNYLDIPAIRWLVKFLRAWPGELMIISHDRGFVDRVTTHSLLIYRGKLWQVEGNSEKLFAKVAEEEELHERNRVNVEKKREHLEKFVQRFGAKASKATQAQSRVKQLEKLATVEELRDEETLSFKFREAPFPGKLMAELRGAAFGYDPAKILFSDITVGVRPGDRLAIIGRNGLGKSTLLKILAGELAPLEGELWTSANVRPGYFGQTNIARLTLERSIADEIQSANEALDKKKVRDICGLMMFEGDDGLKKIKVLSGGERSRVLLGKILAAPTNFLLLDEPDNHLDMESVEALGEAIERYEGAVVMVTHHEELLRSVATRLLVFGSNGATFFEGGYDAFLRERGWEEEGKVKPGSGGGAKAKGGGESAEQRRARAKERADQAAKIKPLERRIRDLELLIAEREAANAKLEAAIVKASADGKSFELATSARELAESKEALETLMRSWEEAGSELDSLRAGAE